MDTIWFFPGENEWGITFSFLQNHFVGRMGGEVNTKNLVTKEEYYKANPYQLIWYYVLIDWVGGPDRKIFGPRWWCMDRVQQGHVPWPSAKYFPVRANLTRSISILLYGHCAFPFFFSWVIKFGMFTYVAILTEKSEFI